MNELAITRYITDTSTGIDIVTASGDSFFFYDPGQTLEKDHRFPFVTLVTGDNYDAFSNLARPGVFRLNIGVGREIFRSLFPTPGRGGDAETGDDENTSHDFTALDRIMPHPVYGKMFWVCVLNPGEATSATVRTLLAEAYELAAARHAKKDGAGW